MKLDCVLTACNENPLYADFIPLFIKTWNKLYPTVDVKIVFISPCVPENLKCYEDNIILFKPLSGISTSFISQYIRLLYPALLDYKNGILITDMDMLPMNRTYYTKNIENFDDDCFVYLRHVLMRENNQIAMCYNVANRKTWSQIFNINSMKDISTTLKNVHDKANYKEGHNNTGWCTDQIDLFQAILNWENRDTHFKILHDKTTGFCRLDRNTFNIKDTTLQQYISNGLFSDYHCYRPYEKYKEINEMVYCLL